MEAKTSFARQTGKEEREGREKKRKNRDFNAFHISSYILNVILYKDFWAEKDTTDNKMSVFAKKYEDDSAKTLHFPGATYTEREIYQCLLVPFMFMHHFMSV